MRQRAFTLAVSILAFYLVSGALLRVGYGYANRGKLAPNDVGWFRHQFAPYGPIPVASLFGSDFARYLGEMSNPWRMPEGADADVIGDTQKHRRELMDIVTKSPNSIWAPSAADALARMEARRQSKLEDSIGYYRQVVDKYPNSPYVAFALRTSARAYLDAGRPNEAEAAYAELQQRAPNSIYRSEALRYLVQSAQLSQRWPDAMKWATQWTTAAPIEDRFDAWVAVAQLRKAQGDDAGAKQAANSALAAIADFKRAMAAGEIKLLPAQKVNRENAAQTAEQAARALL
jgi:tetratricopeptide (TPR) repeat protein